MTMPLKITETKARAIARANNDGGEAERQLLLQSSGKLFETLEGVALYRKGDGKIWAYGYAQGGDDLELLRLRMETRLSYSQTITLAKTQASSPVTMLAIEASKGESHGFTFRHEASGVVIYKAGPRSYRVWASTLGSMHRFLRCMAS